VWNELARYPTSREELIIVLMIQYSHDCVPLSALLFQLVV
jgi:hypothetical protein